MRRVNIYEIEFTYIRGFRITTSVLVAHEDITKAVEFVKGHSDYPACDIQKVLLLINENVLVPEK